MTQEPSIALSAETLMTHMHTLCKEIGPRPATSPQERQAARYVETQLRELGCTEIQTQRFPSQNSLGWVTIPAVLAQALAVPMAALGGRWGKLAGSILLLGGTHTVRESFLGQPPFYQRSIARGNSQNVIACFAPTQSEKRSIFLIAHLDSQKQRRFSTPPPKGAVTAYLLLSAINGLSLLVSTLKKRHKIAWWQWLAGLLPLSMLWTLWQEEKEPHIEGANDNASAVAVLLGIAQALSSQPLERTAVTLLFTGCEEVVCVGIENYLRQLAPARAHTYWIDLEMVGAGRLCYVTRHGISHLTEYAPSPEMVRLAAQTARQYPELGVMGRDMVILEETANLRRRGYDALCLAGYDEQGSLPNWHRLSDTLENIEPQCLSRAARYTWALIQEIDSLPG